MGSKKAFLEVSRSRPHIIILYFSNIVAILFIFLLESLKAPRLATTDQASLKNKHWELK